MTARVLTRLYDSHEEAVEAVRALEAAGFPHDKISIVSNNRTGAYTTQRNAAGGETNAAGAGATAGTIIGGGVGLLAGIGALAIPGVGPVVAAGWLVATLTGAGVGAVVGGGAGGLIEALTNSGVPERDAQVYAEGVRRGGSLVTVRTDEARAVEADAILSRRASVDIGQRRAEYEKSGWTRFDEREVATTEPASRI